MALDLSLFYLIIPLHFIACCRPLQTSPSLGGGIRHPVGKGQFPAKVSYGLAYVLPSNLDR